MISKVEQGEMLWVPDLQGSKEREILRAGDGMMRKYKEENPQQEGPEQVEQHWTLPGRSQGNVSLSPQQEAACENEHKPENHQDNLPMQEVGKGVHFGGGCKDLERTTVQQRISMGERKTTCTECGKSFSNGDQT